MADAAVSYAIQKIGDAIVNEALFQGSVKQQAEDLNQELTGMKSFLQDADAQARGGNALAQNWVKLVREATNDAEDLIESFAIQVYAPGMIRRCGSCSKLMPGALIRRHYFGLEIEMLKHRIINIRESAARYGLTPLPDDRWEGRDVDEATARRTVALHELGSSHVVLMEAEKEDILNRLDPKRETRRSVVSIVGMGGLGKTTLAKKVFKDPRIEKRFGCAFWINVSQHYQDVKLLKDLLCQISPRRAEEYENMERTMLERCLQQSLLGKTYLIVMDDVWYAQVWRIVEKHLPDEGNGSKVLITTRNREVADAADPDQATRAYELRFLNQEESWDLFLSKAIPREEERSACTGRLKELGEQMAAKCGGLPLALVVMGGLLSQKQRSIAEWERVYESMVWQYEGEGQNCMRILVLSYGDLPCDLKWCFLYLCAFPEDYQIESDRLIRLWIAEGFIAERGDGLTLEETAEIQLEKLLERSLLHISGSPEDPVILCRVHDLLRELCISEAKRFDFMSVCLGREPLPAESLRRLSIITEPDESISRLKSAPRLRALLGFNFEVSPQLAPAMNLSVGGLKLIRVIDLQGAGKLKALPKEIGGLVNLRYLGLEGTAIESLPETVKNLSRLQFLNVRHTEIKEMTSAVWEIETLRQVFFPLEVLAPNRVQCRWKSLQVLSSAWTGNWMNDGLHKLKDIQTLDLSLIDASSHAVLSSTLPQFSRLKILRLQGSSIPWTAMTLSGLRLLRQLDLVGLINEQRPGDLSPLERDGILLDYEWPAGLTHLRLEKSGLHGDPLPSLGQLPELRFLVLAHAYSGGGEEMKFRGDGFKQLQVLVLTGLDEPKRMIIADGAMPRLQKLQLSVVQNLEIMIVDDGAMPRLQILELHRLDKLERMSVEDGAMPRLQILKISRCWRLKTIPGRRETSVEERGLGRNRQVIDELFFYFTVFLFVAFVLGLVMESSPKDGLEELELFPT